MARGEGIEPVEGGESAGVDVKAIQAELDAIKAERAAEAAKIADEKKKADEAAAIARGETENLYKAEKAKAETLEAELATFRKAEKARLAKIEASNTERVKALPETARDLIPEGLAGEALAAHLDKLAKFVSTDAGGSEPPRVRVTRQSSGIPDAITQEAAVKGMEPAAWWALVKKHQPERAKKLSTIVEN